MNKLFNMANKIETKADQEVIAFKMRLLDKKDGDGHYIAIIVGVLIALLIGGIILGNLNGDSGMIRTWITSINGKITAFISKFTS